jgi:hypothetical protein
MLDMMDGSADGKVDDSINKHRSLMGDKRWGWASERDRRAQ